MPFTTQEARRMTDAIGPQVVGDRCFLAYREMLRKWKKSPRWTTAHEIYKNVITQTIDQPYDNDDVYALHLAWQVFFQLHVIPYELQKRIDNGEVDTNA